MFQKIIIIIIIKNTQHRNKNKIGATLSGLLLWPGLGSPLGELSRRSLKILEAFTEGNNLKGLGEKNWPLGMGDLSITCGLYSLLGCIKILAFTHLGRTRRLAFLGCQNSSRTNSSDRRFAPCRSATVPQPLAGTSSDPRPAFGRWPSLTRRYPWP